METVPNHTDSCPKARSWSPKGYNPRGRSMYGYFSQAESQSDLRNVMFTDELRFALVKICSDDKRIRIWRKQGIRNQFQNIIEHHAFRGRSIIVWAGISLGYRTDLRIFKQGSVIAVQYRDEVLEPILRLYASGVGPTFVL